MKPNPQDARAARLGHPYARTHRSPSPYAPSRRSPLLICALWLLIPAAAARGGFGGLADVSAVQSSLDGVSQQSLKQAYTVSLDRRLSPYVLIRGSARYYRFAVDQRQLDDSWREDFQPSGELNWRHPSFSFNSSAQRRISDAWNAQGKIYADNLGIGLRTNSIRFPFLTFRYQASRISNEAGASPRETRDRQLVAGADYYAAGQSFSYGFNRRDSENRISGLETTHTDHLLRWSGSRSSLAGGRLQVSSSYLFKYGIAVSERPSSGSILDPIPIVAGMYAEDTSPDLGALEPAIGLLDGDLASQTEPPIDIGAGLVDRNVGADLGFQRQVAGLYVYVDRPSGAGVAWRVYVSNDNLSWSPAAGVPDQTFNLGLSRYEIVFPAVTTRYVKAVNSGLNEVVQVLVTEIAAFEEIAEAERLTRHKRSHDADLVASYRISERISSTTALVYHHAPFGLGGSRDLAGYSLTGQFRQTRAFLHTLAWQQNFESLSKRRGDRRSDALTYTLGYEPMDALSLTLSGMERLEVLDRSRERAMRTGLLLFRGRPIEPVVLAGEMSASRSLDYLSASRVGALTGRISADADLTDALKVTLGLGQQRTRTEPANRTQTRRSYEGGFDFRLTRSILAHGSFELVRDVQESRSQEYLLGWNMSPRVSMSGRASINSIGQNNRSQTYGSSINISIGARSYLYLGVSLLDLSGAGGSRSTQFQQGFRTSF